MTDRTIRIDPARDAVLHVDVQSAFMERHRYGGAEIPDGGLPVPGGATILPAVLELNRRFPVERRYCTLDQHPDGHISWVTSYRGFAPYHELTFEEACSWTDDDHPIVSPKFTFTQLRAYLRRVPGMRQTLWPAHGRMGTPEAELHPALAETDGFRLVFIKGTDPLVDSYSGVRDNLRNETGLAAELRKDGVGRLFLDGLAFTHCVGWTALDLAAEGFEVVVIEEGTKPVPIPGLEQDMRRQLADAGVMLVSLSDIV